jgi:hypothetical protein
MSQTTLVKKARMDLDLITYPHLADQKVRLTHSCKSVVASNAYLIQFLASVFFFVGFGEGREGREGFVAVHISSLHNC